MALKKPIPDALLEHEGHRAVGGRHREQVHDDGLDRHDDRAEHDHQEQERQSQHEAQHDPLVRVGHVEEVQEDGAVPAHVDLHAGHAGERRRHHVVAQTRDGRERRVVLRRSLEEGGDLRGRPVRGGRHLRLGCERGILRDLRLQVLHRGLDLRVLRVTRDDDQRGVGQAAGEVLLEREERRLGGHVGELVDIRRAPLVHLEVERAQTRQDRDADDQDRPRGGP